MNIDQSFPLAKEYPTSQWVQQIIPHLSIYSYLFTEIKGPSEVPWREDNMTRGPITNIFLQWSEQSNTVNRSI